MIPMTESSVPVQHDLAQQKFFLTLQGHEAQLRYRTQGRMLDVFSTFVPESLRGRGLAEQLCKAAFEYAKAQQCTVIPSCPYISGAYLKRHPEYLSLTRTTHDT